MLKISSNFFCLSALNWNEYNTLRSATIISLKEKHWRPKFGRVVYFYLQHKLMNTNEQQMVYKWMGKNLNAIWFKWCYGTLFYFFGEKKLHTHKFYQLQWIPINWYLYAVFACVQQSPTKSSILKNSERHHLLCAFIVLKCYFTILFINCVCGPEICLYSWTNTHSHFYAIIIFTRPHHRKELE